MTASILVTKLFIPSIRRRLVPRPRLIEQLDGGLHRKLTLISAPAGFGKTTVVMEWLDNMRGRTRQENLNEYRIAWLSLDESDNDPNRFLSYIIAALNHSKEIAPAFGRGVMTMLQSSRPFPTEAVLIPLINEIAAIPEKIILVLDDYHLIDAQPVHEALSFLLENQPPHMHLVIATREDPLLPLSRLRAGSQLTELRATDLRFTNSEAADFLNQAMGLTLSAENITVLERRTEGWIAGLQLAAISLQGHMDASTMIQSFSGSHRLVLDYLIEDVLNQQPQQIQDFLLQTAVLKRLTGPLCNALTSQDNGQERLEELEHANLFIIPLDNERRWYRYHHLFADLLRQRLKQTQQEKLPNLHIKASDWYEQNGLTNEAIMHAFHAESFEQAAHLIEGHVNEFWEQGEHVKLKRWLAKLPIELIFSRPHLCIFNAWYSFVSGQQDMAGKCLQAAEQSLESIADRATETSLQKQELLNSAEQIKLRGSIATIRAFMASYQGDIPGMIQYAHEALEYLPENDRTLRSNVALVLGDVYGFKGDMIAAYEARFEAYKAYQSAGVIYFAMLASMKLAITLRSQGHLQRTIDICQEQIQIANECGLTQTPLNGLLLIIGGEVLAEKNELDLALERAKKGVALTQNFMDMGFLGWGYVCMIRILFTRGELAGAEEIIHKIEHTARESNAPPWVISQTATWRTRLCLAQGNLNAASQWVNGLGLNTDSVSLPPQEIDFFSLFNYIMLGRVLIALGRLEEATGLLKHLLESAETGGRTTRMIEIRILKSLAYQAQGDIDQATIQLEHALTQAEPEGFMRIFVDEGPPMAQLLRAALSREIAPNYVRQLLAAFPDAEPEKAKPSNSQITKSKFVDPLSEREIEVLQLIAAGLTNPEIAARLFLSLNTVKVHTRNIYGKLDAHSRTQAVAKARALDILTA